MECDGSELCQQVVNLLAIGEKPSRKSEFLTPKRPDSEYQNNFKLSEGSVELGKPSAIDTPEDHLAPLRAGQHSTSTSKFSRLVDRNGKEALSKST